jgi:hypothetical protein
MTDSITVDGLCKRSARLAGRFLGPNFGLECALQHRQDHRVDDVFRCAAAAQIVAGLLQALQERSVGTRSAKPLGDLVADNLDTCLNTVFTRFRYRAKGP